MPAETDSTTDTDELMLQEALRQQRTSPQLPPTGRCYYCDQCVPGDYLFCNRICNYAYKN